MKRQLDEKLKAKLTTELNANLEKDNADLVNELNGASNTNVESSS